MPDGRPLSFYIRQGEIACNPMDATRRDGESKIRLAQFQSRLKDNLQPAFDFYHLMTSFALEHQDEYHVKRVRNPFDRNHYTAWWRDGDVRQEISFHVTKSGMGKTYVVDSAKITTQDSLLYHHDPSELTLTFGEDSRVSALSLMWHSHKLGRFGDKCSNKTKELEKFIEKYLYGGMTNYDLLTIMGGNDHNLSSRYITMDWNSEPFFQVVIGNIGEKPLEFSLLQLPDTSSFVKGFKSDHALGRYARATSSFLGEPETEIPHASIESFVSNLFASVPKREV